MTQHRQPETLNAIALTSIDNLLELGTEYGNELSQRWFSGILKDAIHRSIRPKAVKEKLLNIDGFYYGLAGMTPLQVKAITTAIDADNIHTKADNPSPQLSKILGIQGIANMFVYHAIRENLNHVQKKFKITSLEERFLAIRDNLFCYKDYDSQMVLLPSDRKILKLEVPRIVDYFNKVTSDYHIYETTGDDERIFDGSIGNIALRCDYAWIFDKSYHWTPGNDGAWEGKCVDKQDPDEINLCLLKWNKETQDYDTVLDLEARHPDPSRRPFAH
jgi:hypothetical protein